MMEKDADMDSADSSTEEVKNVNKFALLGLNEDGSDGLKEEEEGDSDKPRISPTAQKRKNKKKRKANKPTVEEEDDEFLNLGAGTVGRQLQEGGETLSIEELFKVDPRGLDGDAELRKVRMVLLWNFQTLSMTFGAPARSEGRNRGHVRRPVAGKIVKQKSTWPPLKSVGKGKSGTLAQGFRCLSIRKTDRRHGSASNTTHTTRSCNAPCGLARTLSIRTSSTKCYWNRIFSTLMRFC